MNPLFQDDHVTLYNADFLKNELSVESVQCVVTSPPYFGLRRYDAPDSVWGSDKECVHQWQITAPRRERKVGDIKNLASKEATNTGNLGVELATTNTCSLCGAWKGQFGAEPTPDCGRPFMELREDLTGKELEYVMAELKRCDLI